VSSGLAIAVSSMTLVFDRPNPGSIRRFC
jgi:hypothetical protein